jgi:hypothetical protein
MYNKIKTLNDEQFRRKTGVKRNTFAKMLEVVSEYENKRKKLSGRPLKLNYEDQIILSLTYLREYITYFSLGNMFGISEANCYKICRKIEDILISSKVFNLPNKRELYENAEIKTVVIDATESKIQRPKKSKESIIQQRKKVTQ